MSTNTNTLADSCALWDLYLAKKAGRSLADMPHDEVREAMEIHECYCKADRDETVVRVSALNTDLVARALDWGGDVYEASEAHRFGPVKIAATYVEGAAGAMEYLADAIDAGEDHLTLHAECQLDYGTPLHALRFERTLAAAHKMADKIRAKVTEQAGVRNDA